MSEATRDPYEALGVTSDVSDEELRRVYRALIKRYHPDHNGGSAESAARFAQIQEAYARLVASRRLTGGAPLATDGSEEDAGIEQRIADLERELAAIRERERRTARSARDSPAFAAYQQPRKPTREELGYYETDDSFTKILDDAGGELGQRVKGARRSELTRRLTDFFGGGGE